MARPPNTYGRYIERRGHRFFAVLKVPKELHQQLGRTRYIKALGTDSPTEARRRVPMLITAWKTEIAKAREDGTDPLASDAAWFKKALANAATPFERQKVLNDIELEASNRASPTYMDTDDAVQRAAQEAYAAEEAQEFYDRAVGELAGFTDYLDDWLAKWNVTGKTKDMARAIAKQFGKSHPTVRDVTHEAVQRWIDGLDVAPATIQRSLSALRTYWKFLQRSDIKAVPRDVQPFTDLDLPKLHKGKNGKRDQRKPFSPRDIVKLRITAFHQPDQQLYDLISMAMFTGCRIEELCSLTIKNVHDSYIEIEDAKTAAGWRQVPIHSALQQTLAGLIEQSNDGYVISGLSPNKYGDRSNAIGKRFGRLKKATGFGPEYVFHSIRKTVATLLENAGVPENVSADILGHEKPRITYGLYSGGTSLAVKAEAIEKLAYSKQ